MPARASYELRVEGILDGTKADNSKAIAEFHRVFPPNAPEKTEGALGAAKEWPDGFVLKNYRACLWKSDGYDYGAAKNKTLLAFNAEVSIFLPSAIYDAPTQSRLLEDVEWFYKYRDQAWFKDLDGKTAALRHALANGWKVLEVVRFQQWKWYCGNGGGE